MEKECLPRCRWMAAGAPRKLPVPHEIWLARKGEQGSTTHRSCDSLLSERTAACCSGGTGAWGQDASGRLPWPIHPFTAQRCPTRRPQKSLRGDILQLLKGSKALIWTKSPRLKELERQQTRRFGSHLSKALQTTTERSRAAVSCASCAPHFSNQSAIRRLLHSALLNMGQ